MTDQYERRDGLKREDILALREGEVIKYRCGILGVMNYLVVESVDAESGKVSGHISNALGVNAVSIEELVREGIDIAKFSKSE